MDQSGCSLRKIIGRSLRKGVGEKGKRLIQKCIGTKGDFDSAIVHDWAKHFVQETASLRKNHQRLLLFLDGYAAHIQFETLNLIKQNNIIVLALPSHTSHQLQHLDVTVSGPFKSYLQRELHRCAKIKKQFNAFDIAAMLHNAYDFSFVAPTIASGFAKAGIWDNNTKKTNPSALNHLFMSGCESNESVLDSLLNSFMRKQRSLLRDVDVGEQGRIMIDTVTGAHLTSDKVLCALQKRKEQKLAEAARKKRLAAKADMWADVRESAAAVKHLGTLAERRIKQRKLLRLTRDRRRRDRRTIATFNRTYKK